MRAIRSIEAVQKPRIVTGCAVEKDTRRAMLSSKEMLAVTASMRETALTASSLLQGQQRTDDPLRTDGRTDHFGSGISMPCASVPPGGISVLQYWTSAQTLKVFAIGPNVPAKSGNAVEAYHHLAGTKNDFTSSSSSMFSESESS